MYITRIEDGRSSWTSLTHLIMRANIFTSMTLANSKSDAIKDVNTSHLFSYITVYCGQSQIKKTTKLCFQGIPFMCQDWHTIKHTETGKAEKAILGAAQEMTTQELNERKCCSMCQLGIGKDRKKECKSETS